MEEYAIEQGDLRGTKVKSSQNDSFIEFLMQKIFSIGISDKIEGDIASNCFSDETPLTGLKLEDLNDMKK